MSYYDDLRHLRCFAHSLPGVSRWSYVRDLLVGQRGQSFDQVLDVGPRLHAMISAADDQRVQDCALASGVFRTDEQPVLLAEGRRPNGILHPVVIDIQPSVTKGLHQRLPLVLQIGQRLPQSAGRGDAVSGLKDFRGFFDSTEDGQAF